MATTLVTIQIDRDACVGFGECVSEDPEAVVLEADGTASVRVAELEQRRAERLCASCPAGAIHIC